MVNKFVSISFCTWILSFALLGQEPTTVRYLGLVQVKGKEETVKIYECFDGDAVGAMTLKKETLADFDTGMNLFFLKKFDEAERMFKTIIAKSPEDKATHLFLQKSIHLKGNKVDATWRGVERMLEK